jgi:hypothetical protein
MKSRKIYKIGKSQSIFIDDSFKGHVSPRSGFRVLTMDATILDWKKTADGLYNLIVPTETGLGEILVENNENRYYIRIQSE